MRNSEWASFVGIRDRLRETLASLIASYLTSSRDDLTTTYMLGRIAGAIYVLNDLPYAHGSRDELERAMDPAHHLNRRGGRPCGCQTRKRCVVEGVDPNLRAILARTDPGLHLELESWEDGYDDEWDDEDEDEDS